MLKALRDSSCRTISFKKMEWLVLHDMVDWASDCVLMPIHEEQQKPVYHLDIQELRIKHTKVFNEISPGRPVESI